jgi:two-component system, chemotaxis family, protein-glutamate methylesterase/glutaminase
VNAGRPVRVLICDDSATSAGVLSRILTRDRTIEVAGVCPTAEQAIKALPSLKPDLVTMDLQLPGMSGLDAIEQIMSSHPIPILVVSSQIASRKTSTLVAAALAAGALDAVGKGELDLRDPVGADGVELRRRVKVLSGARVIRHPRGAVARRSPSSSPVRSGAAIGICASTGGPPALAALLHDLPATYPIPILVVQHIAAGFTDGFAKWLGSELRLRVSLATDGQRLGRGVWIAPEDAHLVLDTTGRLALDGDTPGRPHRPSGDVLLRSLAGTLGPECIGIVLTGMGADGAEGLAAIRAAGGSTIAQDEASSAVYGMPKAAAPSAELILPIEGIAGRLAMLRATEALT